MEMVHSRGHSLLCVKWHGSPARPQQTYRLSFFSSLNSSTHNRILSSPRSTYHIHSPYLPTSCAPSKSSPAALLCGKMISGSPFLSELSDFGNFELGLGLDFVGKHQPFPYSPHVPFTDKGIRLLRFSLLYDAPRYAITFDEDLITSFTPEMEVKLTPDNLVGIDILEVNINKMLVGKYFLCRTITPTIKSDSLDAVVEDPEGIKAVQLSLFNFTTFNIDQVLPLGMFLLIKNPCFAENSLRTAIHLVSFNPVDVELLTPFKLQQLFPEVEWKSNPEEYKTFGLWNVVRTELPFFTQYTTGPEIFKQLKSFGDFSAMKRHYADAIRWYTLCLDYCAPGSQDEMDVWINQADALVQFRCYNPALKIFDKILDSQPTNVKCIYNKTKALVGLRAYKEARDYVRDMLETIQLSGNKDLLGISSMIPAVALPSREQEINDLAFALIKRSTAEQAVVIHQTPDFYPEYVGPVSTCARSTAVARSLIATHDIQPGQILLAMRPFATYSDKIPRPRYPGPLPFSMDQDPISKRAYAHLTSQIANKIRVDPTLGFQVYNLWAGPELGFLKKNAGNVDIRRIRNILRLNATEIASSDSLTEMSHGAGLWTLAPSINHSCSDPNAFQLNFGNYLVVRAFKFIPEGAEIFISIDGATAAVPYSDRVAKLKMKGYKECHCRLCVVDQKESVEVVQERLLTINALSKWNCTHYVSQPGLLSEALRLVDNLRCLRVPELNVFLLNSCVQYVARSLYSMRQFKACLGLLQHLHHISSTMLPLGLPYGHFFAEKIIHCYLNMEDDKRAKEWALILKGRYIQFYGSLKSFKTTYASLLNTLEKKYGPSFILEKP